MSAGIGTLSLNRWYFNSETQSCEEFVYFGMKGNENNYLTKDQCQLECLGSIGTNNAVHFKNSSVSLLVHVLPLQKLKILVVKAHLHPVLSHDKISNVQKVSGAL